MRARDRSDRSSRSMRRLALLAALAVSAATLAACSLLTGLDADYSASGHDGAIAPVGEGGGGDGPSADGEGMDGSTMTDGMVKPDAMGDGGVLSFCESAQRTTASEDFFCTDFETESFPGDASAPKPWATFTNLRDAGAMSFVDSGGSRVLDVMATSTTGNGAGTYLKVGLAQTKQANLFKQYVFEFRFHVIDSTLDYEALGLLVFKPFDPTGENGISGYGPGLPHQLSHQGTGTATPPTLVVANGPPTTWWHAVITLTRTDAGTSYDRSIKIGGNPVDESPSGHAIPMNAPTEVWMGAFNADTTAGTAHIQFDDVVLRRTP